jgi:LCP family protein required for cell wall assembly
VSSAAISILFSTVPTSQGKPYKVYRQPRRARGSGQIDWSGLGGSGRRSDGPNGSPPWQRGSLVKRFLKFFFLRLLPVVIVLALIWVTVAYLSFRGAVKRSNAKVPKAVKAQLSATDGPALASARNILVIGSDTRGGVGDAGRSDSMMIVRVDPSHRRFAMLSIPRDLRVEIPGYGHEKINAAFSLGGPALTLTTIRGLTGLPVHHYVQIDFKHFKRLIDGIGGVDVVNPKPIVSAPFDGRNWRFGKGKLHLDGRRALAYSRVRKNLLDPGESDFTRGARQQQILDAVASKVRSAGTLKSPRKVPKAVVEPLITDISASQMIAFAIARQWATGEHTLKCRLGGEIAMVDGQSVIRGDEENRAVIRMFLGKQPPLAPQTEVNQFAPGCTHG